MEQSNPSPQSNLNPLDPDLTDGRLITDVAGALQDSKERGTHPVKIAATLVGMTTMAVVEAGGNLEDLLQTSRTCWDAFEQVRASSLCEHNKPRYQCSICSPTR